ncbi:3'-5' exonuclease [Phymastichus coffea]|uniref:3'-5' exonuclease n=1 Tax=Phymastichus coffea TaxID=108790 RepID=UPI00273A77A8|nr:3'-5' exonuclease [Phymastichus coffea]
MSKETATKRLRPITAWLKKENVQTVEIDKNEIKAKILKQTTKSIRVCLTPLDKNIIDQLNSNKQSNFTSEKNRESRKKSPVEQSQGNRRSARNFQTNEKSEKEISKKEPEIDDLPPIVFQGQINYVHNFYDCARICDVLLTEVESNNDSIVPVGFDLEWPFSFQTGSGKTALAQICLSEKICHLLYLYKIKKLPASFIALLSHPKVKLVGVNIKNDVWKLSRDFNEFPGQKVVDNNCLDCGPYANKVLNRSVRWSLERLTAYLLKRRINKDPSVRRSKWHIHPLTDAQKLYAATDAYVSFLLHLTIEQQEALADAEELK